MFRGDLSTALGDPTVELDELLVVVAGHERAGRVADWVRNQLDLLAAAAPDDLDGFLAFVFGEVGFRGDTEHYFSPQNSMIDRVLVRRRGNPLALCCITAELGRRRGLDLQPIGLPGHVVLGAGERLFDAFAGGRELGLDDCAALLRASSIDIEFEPSMLQPMSAIWVAARTLANLRVAHLRAGDLSSMADVLARRDELPSVSIAETEEYARILSVVGRHEQAAAVFERLIDDDPTRATGHRAEVLRLRARNN